MPQQLCQQTHSHQQVHHLAAPPVHPLPLKDRVHQHRQQHNHLQQAPQVRLAQHLDHLVAPPVYLLPLKDKVQQLEALLLDHLAPPLLDQVFLVKQALQLLLFQLALLVCQQLVLPLVNKNI